MNPVDQLEQLAKDLQDVGAGRLGASSFSMQARGQRELLSALPPKYSDVLLQLLDRLESSALFTDESCSFSQRDLLDSLQLWLDKARQQLGKPVPPPGS